MKWPSFDSIRLYSSNLIIRGLTIGSRFIFTFFLGKVFSEELLGEYGLFSTTILISYFILSLSFDSFALREIIQKPVEQRATYIRNLFAFYCISFLVAVPFTALFFIFDVLPGGLFLIFLVILFTETFNQTLFSLFTILQKSVTANIVLFLNQAAWILVVLVVWYFRPGTFVTVGSFLVFWIFSGLGAIIYGYLTLKKLFPQPVQERIDFRWIRSGLSVSLIFFVSTLAYKLLEFSDRYLIEAKLGLGQLGIYVFYGQIANLLNAVINVTVIVMLYPKLIDRFVNSDIPGFLHIRDTMYRRVLGIAVSLSLMEVLFIEFLLEFMGKESFSDQIMVFYFLLLSNLLMNLSFVPHYCLYALRKDYVLLTTTLIGCGVNISLNFFLIPTFGLVGAAVSAVIGFSLVLILKVIYLRKYLAAV